MQIDRIAVMLRPRNPWEAMDLGMRMALQWWKPVYGAWLAAYLPVIAIITWICAELNQPWIAWLAVWWVKPLLERVPLFVLSHAVFGEVPRSAAALRAIPGLLRVAPLWRLLLTRLFSFNRSFCLPVVMLEGLRGKERRARFRVLLKGMASAPVWLTIVCANLEQILAFGAYSLFDLFLPRTLEAELGLKELFVQGLPDWYIWLFYGVTVFAYLVIGPLYVASGFSLYLNRRTWLEGWDIELGFRRMAQRLGEQGAWARAAAIVLCVGTLSFALPPDAHAANVAPRNAVAKQHIEQVMRRPEFSTKKTVESWRYIGKRDEEEPSARNPLWEALRAFGKGLAWIVKGFLYLVLFAALVWLIINHERWLNWMRGVKPAPRYQPPAQLFGLDIRPESLPENVAEAANQMWRAGDARGALSLLYRGALSRLAQQENVSLSASDTEGDCLRVVQHTQAPATSGYFAQLTAAWQAVAYAGRAPQADVGETLCRAYPEHFGAAR
jgi:hypothetical protein